MTIKRVPVFIGCLLGLLLLAVGAQFFFSFGRPPGADKLAFDVIPAAFPGAEIKDMEIADTEQMSKAIEEGLGFSDHRYREYRKERVQFTVYLAYWQDRKRHFVDIGTHAPDNCWVTNGWTMAPKLPKKVFALQRPAGPVEAQSLGLSGPANSQLSATNSQRSDLQVKLSTSTATAVAAATWPAESRVFLASGNTIHVVYWHLLDGKPLDYSRYGTGKTVGYLLDNVSHYWRGTGEQYFLRISSNVNMEELEKDPIFQEMLASLAAHLPLCASSDVR